jgi:hypothetical protein
MTRVTGLLALLVLVLGCGSAREAEAMKAFAEREKNGIARVKVDQLGDIYLNDAPTTLAALGDEFSRLRDVRGVVWYYRVSTAQKAEESGAAVMAKVIEFKLPVKLCSGSDPCRDAFK